MSSSSPHESHSAVDARLLTMSSSSPHESHSAVDARLSTTVSGVAGSSQEAQGDARLRLPISSMLAQSPSIVPLTASHEPIFNGVIIPYHVTPAPRLLSVTFDKLEGLGFSRSSFGDHDGATLGKLPGPSTASALLQFTSFTKSLLPSRAGGSNEDAPFTPSKATSSILSAVSAGRSAFGQEIEARSEAELLAGVRGDRGYQPCTNPSRYGTHIRIFPTSWDRLHIFSTTCGGGSAE
jgi:hypothetical protein